MQVVLVPNFVTVDIIREINVILNLFRNLIISNEILYFLYKYYKTQAGYFHLYAARLLKGTWTRRVSCNMI